MLAKCQAFLSLQNVCQLVSNGNILAPDLTTVYKELYALNPGPMKGISPPPFPPFPVNNDPPTNWKTKLWTVMQKHSFWQTSHMTLRIRKG